MSPGYDFGCNGIGQEFREVPNVRCYAALMVQLEQPLWIVNAVHS